MLQNGDVTADVWRDKRGMLLLSSNSDSRPDVTVSRKRGTEEIKIPCPEQEKLQVRKYYGVGRFLKKWWKYGIHFINNVFGVKTSITFYLIPQPTGNFTSKN
jgi:hypothetical protein